MIDMYRQVIRRALLDNPSLTCVELARQLISITRQALGFRRVYCRVRGGTPHPQQVRQFLEAQAGAGINYVSLDESGFDPQPVGNTHRTQVAQRASGPAYKPPPCR